MARDIIVVLFTTSYLASVPIFMLWTLTIAAVGARVSTACCALYAQTRFLLGHERAAPGAGRSG